MENRILKPFIPAILPENKKRYYLICGGRAGGRSYFASQYATAKLFSSGYFRCGIMRYVQGDIRNSIYQEIVDRIEEQNLKELKDLSLKEHILTFNYKKNTINGIGFRKSSSDQKAKLKSLAGYTDIIIEEAEEVSEEDFNQLDDSLRTIKADIRIILLFNMPDKNHWINKRFFNLVDSGVDGFYRAELKEEMKENTEFIFTYWKNNEINLNQTTIDNFKRYEQTNPDHYWNMIMGLVPSGKRGVIYKNWTAITDAEFDDLDYTTFYGLDFGFTNDQCALIEIKQHNDKIYCRQKIYELGLLNKNLSDKMEQLGISKDLEIIADNAEPKSIAELQGYGWNVIPSEKGQGSRKSGVAYLLSKEVYYTENSKDLIFEVQNYCWALNKDKEPTNEPADGNDHLLDALRGAIFTKANQPFVGVA